MAAPDPRNIVRAAGRLVKDPTDFTAAYPYGGTELGVVGRIKFRRGVVVHHARAEEWGGVRTKTTYQREDAVIACTLREWDDDMIAALFPNVAAGSGTGKQVVTYDVDTGNRAGYDLTGNSAMSVLFAPFAAEHHRAVFLRNAVPMEEAAAEASLSLNSELGIAVVFIGQPDSSQRVYEDGMLEDLTV